MATPGGERPIATLKVGDHVLAYDPTTGKRATQTIVKVFLNHDHDRLDVTLALPATHAASATTAAPSQPARDAETAREQARRAAGHGLRAPPDAPITPSSVPGAPGPTEVIHTTANHPWLTTDRGWLVAGDLQVGEAVRLLDGGTTTVVALRTLPGVGPMWDLGLDAVHTFSVGEVRAVVHNCGASPYSGNLVTVPKPDANADALASRINGMPRVKFDSDPTGREFDAISDQYVAQTKPVLTHFCHVG